MIARYRLGQGKTRAINVLATKNEPEEEENHASDEGKKQKQFLMTYEYVFSTNKHCYIWVEDLQNMVSQECDAPRALPTST